MKNDKLKNQYRINEQIRVREVRMSRSCRDFAQCQSACMPSHRLLKVPLPAEEAPEGNEGEAG